MLLDRASSRAASARFFASVTLRMPRLRISSQMAKLRRNISRAALQCSRGSTGGEWRDVFSFAFLILFLTFKPTGLLGARVVERM